MTEFMRYSLAECSFRYFFVFCLRIVKSVRIDHNGDIARWRVICVNRNGTAIPSAYVKGLPPKEVTGPFANSVRELELHNIFT